MAPNSVELDPETFRAVSLAARIAKKTEAQVIAMAIESLVGTGTPAHAPASVRQSVTGMIPVYCRYQARRVDAEFNPNTQDVRITRGAGLDGNVYTSLSAAGVAVIKALNKDRGNVTVNGWRFWRLKATGQYVTVLR